jgi:glutaredoxin 3
VIVFSKSYCPYCARTKALFQRITEEEPFTNILVKVLELDQTAHGSLVQQALLERTEQRTVPNVFVGGRHVGGSDITHSMAASGQLQEMLSSIETTTEL